MSAVKVTAALEKALATVLPSLPTALQNEAFTAPPASQPYQRAWVIFADPDNSESGPGFLEQGFLQIDLLYPLAQGWGPARARAELLRSTFRKGASVVSGGQVVTIMRTPSIAPGPEDPDHYVQIVRIRFQASSTA